MQTRDLTQGPIFQRLIYFSLPMIAGNLLQQLYNLVDTFVVGRYVGSDALAAVGSVYTLMTFITSIIIGLCMGSGALFSESYGRQDSNRLKQDIFHSFIFILAVTVLVYLIIYPGMRLILNLLQTPDSLLAMTKDYVVIVFAGIFFTFLYNFFAYILRALGNSVVPLVFLAISSAINIVFDIWWVAGLGMGVQGAAWATLFAQLVAGLGLAIYAYKKLPILHFSWHEICFDSFRMKEIIANDVATGIQQSVMNLGILMIQALVNSFGTVVMASFAAAVKIDTLAYMPAQEFGNAYSLFISQNYGAGKKDRIKKGTRVAFITSVIFCLIISLGIFIFAQDLMTIFIDAAKTDIIAEGVRYLHIEGAMYVGIGILFLWYGYFRGVAKPHISLILTILSLGTRVVLSYALAPHTALGVVAIWLSIPIGWVLADLVGLGFYNSKK